MNKNLSVKWLLILPGIMAMLTLFIIPLSQLAITSIFDAPAGETLRPTLTHYIRFLSNPHYQNLLMRTLSMGAVVSIITLVLGYCLAYGIARTEPKYKTMLMLLVVLPLLTSAVIRSFGWIISLGRFGFINGLLVSLGLIKEPLSLLYTMNGVIIALVHILLPFMVLVLYSVIDKLDRNIEDAALSLGASPVKAFFLVTLPLTKPGILAGTLLVFSLAISFFITPAMIGGPTLQVMATEIYDQALHVLDWPFASAIAIILLIAVLLLISLYSRSLSAGKEAGSVE